MSSSISSSKRSVICFAAAFAAVLVTCVGASEWLVRTQVAPIDTMTQHAADFRVQTAKQVAFGDSRIARGFAAEAPFHNLAYPSENLDQMMWKIDTYIARNGAPERMILQADPHMFSAYRLEAGMADYEAMLGKTSGRPELMILQAYHKPKVRKYWQSYIENSGKLSSKIERTDAGTLLSPGDLSKASEALRTEFAAKRVTLQTPIEGFAQTSQAAAYRALVERLSNAGTEICLLQTPTSPDYQTAIAALPEVERARINKAEAWFAETAKRVGAQHASLENLTADRTLFRDTDHLNAKGARQFASEFMEACFPVSDVNAGSVNSIG